MKAVIVGIWAVLVTLGAGYAVAQLQIDAPADETTPAADGLNYVSLPTLSVPVVEAGQVSGYVVVRLVYTAEATVLRSLAAKPDAFIADAVFRRLYGNADTLFGRLVRLDLEALAEEARAAVNDRLGDTVVQDILIDGLNYIDLGRQDPPVARRAGNPPAILPGDSAPEAQNGRAQMKAPAPSPSD